MAYKPSARADTREAHMRAVQRVIETMRQRLDADMSLGDMARVAYMSRYHFVRTFRDVTGVPPRQFLRALRLQTAKRLLVETSSSVTDVCFDVGYNSLGTFVRYFTDLLGVSPRRLRAMAQKQSRELAEVVPSGSDRSGAGSVLAGTITAPQGFDGAVFVGLFASAIPQGTPLACAISIDTEYRYRISGIGDGAYYLFALGVPWSTSNRDFVLGESALRAGGIPIDIRNGQAASPTDLHLRHPSPLDPPLLVTLPALLGRRPPVHMAADRRRTHSAVAG